MKCVCDLLGIGEDKVFNVVCVPSRAKLKVEHDGELTRYGSLVERIKWHDKVVLDDVDSVVDEIRKGNVIDKDVRKKHVDEVRELVSAVGEDMCPKCGAKLVKRNGKYGEFVGCARYPKCKYVRKGML